MLDLNPIKSITERDIDLLLLEELTVNPEFQEWFASRVFGQKIFKSIIRAWHSVNHTTLGESDLLFLFQSTEESRIALLIENKIDAAPQPAQAERYRQRGDSGKRDGYWDMYMTCAVAPRKYLDSAKHSGSYDLEISYEEIFAYFQSQNSRDLRFGYKAGIIIEAIEKNRRGYQPEYNAPLTQFVADYYAYVNEQFPDLSMQKPKPRPAGSNWITFYPDSIPKGYDLIHQFTAGRAKAVIYGEPEDFDNIKDKFSKLLPSEADFDIHAKSVGVYIPIDKIDPFSKSFLEQKDIVDVAIQKIIALKGMIERAL